MCAIFLFFFSYVGRENSYQAQIGFCGYTNFDEGNCNTSEWGAWHFTGPITSCIAKCHSCERCRYVSFSHTNEDCSWYFSCDRTNLKLENNGETYKTILVKQNELLDESMCIRRTRTSPAVLVSSTSSTSFQMAQSINFSGSVLGNPVPIPLWFYHDTRNIENQRTAIAVPSLPPWSSVCFVDLFLAMS